MALKETGTRVSRYGFRSPPGFHQQKSYRKRVKGSRTFNNSYWRDIIAASCADRKPTLLCHKGMRMLGCKTKFFSNGMFAGFLYFIMRSGDNDKNVAWVEIHQTCLVVWLTCAFCTPRKM